MSKSLLSLSLALAMTFCTAESGGSALAQTAGGYSKYIQAVDEYVPAPGQFVNVYPEYAEGDDAAAMAAKCTEMIAGNNRGLVSLGGFGGYITFHFDHSVANVRGHNDIYIAGNSAASLFEGYDKIGGSAEPGVVMVSRDDNGNGLPDDKWYELRGSADADSAAGVRFGYGITYKYDAMKDVAWTDNAGGSGHVLRNNAHKQEYYPLWLTGSDLSFQGTLLPANGVDTDGNGRQWVLMFYRYGYVDNKPNNDSTACAFNIDWAVDENRNPVYLDKIDFVRVYCAANQNCGWIGEVSTEITNAFDLHLEESVARINGADPERAVTATFEDLSLNAGGAWSGPDITGRPVTGIYGDSQLEGTFASGTYSFSNNYSLDWGSWSGFAYSASTETKYETLADQYNCAAGSGYAGSKTFAVANNTGTINVLNKAGGDIVRGFYITNSAYTLNSIKNGDAYSRKFGEGDFFKVIFTGKHQDGTESVVEYYLADYRSPVEAERYYVDTWRWVDLTPLGKVVSISFAFDGSDRSAWGLNTPSYFCMDNFNEDGHSTDISAPVAGSDCSGVYETGRYTLDGKLLDAPVRGVNIIRYSDGTARKVVVGQ